eukprot:m.26417 g.26417  ORF g.26417 m.26417 type:complete len:348 (-) comp6304_c0_seq1:143-1186(-)
MRPEDKATNHSLIGLQWQEKNQALDPFFWVHQRVGVDISSEPGARPAVQRERVAAHHVRPEQEERGVNHVALLGDPPQRNPRGDRRHGLWTRPLAHPSVDKRGVERVDPNPVRPQLKGHHPCEGVDGAFAAAVPGVMGDPEHRGQARERENRPAAATGHHQPGDRLRYHKRSLHVHPKHPLEALELCVEEGLECGDGGAVDQQVGGCASQRGLHLHLGGDVGGGCLDRRIGARESLQRSVVGVNPDHLGALVAQRHCNRPANPRACTCHHRHLPDKLFRAWPSRSGTLGNAAGRGRRKRGGRLDLEQGVPRRGSQRYPGRQPHLVPRGVRSRAEARHGAIDKGNVMR